ncbi:MAG: HAD family hydrolase, partial [Pseudomonadota bacterium]
VRDPAAMIASYTEKRGSVRAQDLGLAKQVTLYKRVCELTGQAPPVVDSKDVLENPAAMLRLLCEHLGVEANLPMCHWPKGRRDTDGVWASHWYNAVEASTGFAPYKASSPDLDAAQQLVLAECEPDYQFFHERRLRL